MSSPDQIARQARRNRMWMMILALLVVALIGLAAGMFVGRPGDPEAAPEEPQSPASPELTPQANTGGEEFEPVPGENTEEGGLYEVNFPATPEGAASAMLAALEAEGTNDLPMLTRAYQTYHQGTWDEDLVEGDVLEMRAFDMDLNALDVGSEFDEDFPGEGTYWYDQPLAIAWEVVDDETIKVMTLVNQEVSDGADFYSRHRYIHVRTLVWDPETRGGDWMVTSIDDRNILPVKEEHEVTYERWSPIRFPETGVRLPQDDSS